MSTAVAFSYRGELLPNNHHGSNPPDRSELFAKLRQRDLLPIVTLDGELAFNDDGVEALTFDGLQESTSDIGTVGLENVGLLVNHLDRSIKKDELPRPDLLPPMINENATRSLGHRKIRAHHEVLGPLGLDLPTTLVTSEEDLETYLEAHDAPTMIVKPNSGSGSKGVMQVPRHALEALFSQHPELIGTHIMQPAYDFTRPFPSGVKPYDAASRKGFEGWNVAGQVKELRMYGFRSPVSTAVFPAARAIKDGDQWFFVDPDSLPARVIDGTRQAMARVAEISGALAVYGSVDYGYGSVGTEDPNWHAIELNAKMPYLVGYDKHVQVADTLRELFADQINATATR